MFLFRIIICTYKKKIYENYLKMFGNQDVYNLENTGSSLASEDIAAFIVSSAWIIPLFQAFFIIKLNQNINNLKDVYKKNFFEKINLLK